MNAPVIDFPSPSKLSADYRDGRLKEFFAASFTDSKAPYAAAAGIDSRTYPRRSLCEILLRKNIEYGAGPETIAAVNSLADPQTLCVFAGQQPGMLISPMYVVYKALAAVKLARSLELLLERKVIPCFWIASDDHDFDEIKTAAFSDKNGNPVRFDYRPAVIPSKLPLDSIVLDHRIADFIENVAAELPDSEFKPALLDDIRACYGMGEKLTVAFGKLFMKFLGKWGIVLVDPNAPGIKRHFADIFAGEIKEHNKSFELYSVRTQALIAAGYHAQVHKTQRQLNLFYHLPQRINLLIDGADIVADGTDHRWQPDKLLDLIAAEPESFSPNVLLRPIAQCHVFPVVAQIVGPSELAYFAQIEPWFDLFDVPHPVIFPRPQATIVEPHVARNLKKYGVEPAELKADPNAIGGKVIERLFPSEAADSLTILAADYCRNLETLAAQQQTVNPDSANLLLNYRKKIDFEARETAKKLKSSNKKRHDEIIVQLKKAHDLLFPDSQLQERLVSPVYYIAKYGQSIFDKIAENLDIERAGHSAIYL